MSSSPKWDVWAPRLVAAIVAAVFARVVVFPFVEWDDAKYILANPLIAGGVASEPLDWLLTPQLGYVVPVTVAFERLLFLVGGGTAWPFHLAAVLLHAGNAWLVADVGERLGAGRKTAAVAALAWALHPIVAEPVSWATGIKDVLALVFVLGCVRAFLRERNGVATLLAVAAFATKPTTVLLPIALVALGRGSRKTIAGISGFAIVFAVLSALMRTVQIADRIGGTGNSSTNPLAIVAVQFENYLAPLALHPLYAVEGSVWQWLFGASIVLVLGAITWAVRREPPVRFALLFALVLYLPSSQLIPFPRTMADSFLYAPTAGLWIALALGPWQMRQKLLPIALVVVAVLGLVSLRQSARWRSNEALWLPLIADDPQWAYPCVLLAQGYMQERRPDAAAHLYEQAMARQYAPQYLSAMGEALYAAGRLADAQCVLEEDFLFGTTNPERARRNLERLQQLPGIDAATVAFTAGTRTPRSCAVLRRAVERVGVAERGKQ